MMADGCADRDYEQCKGIVRDHYPQIYRFLLHMTRDAGLAEDLTQETFATAWQKFEYFENRSSIGTWLCRIAYGKFIDQCRKRQADMNLTKNLKNKLQDCPPATDPMDSLLADERSRRLYQAVQTLDDDDRLLVVLHYLQDKSFSELAEILASPVGTVKWRVNQALARLRKLMEE
jgi:RNA polymerase sigma-70 factor (ECF subfamily)